MNSTISKIYFKLKEEKQMKIKQLKSIILLVILCSLITISKSQTRTVGLFLNDSTNAFPGYTLFAPKHDTMTYLINNDGKIIHEWTASRYVSRANSLFTEERQFIKGLHDAGSTPGNRGR